MENHTQGAKRYVLVWKAHGNVRGDRARQVSRIIINLKLEQLPVGETNKLWMDFANQYGTCALSPEPPFSKASIT